MKNKIAKFLLPFALSLGLSSSPNVGLTMEYKTTSIDDWKNMPLAVRIDCNAGTNSNQQNLLLGMDYLIDSNQRAGFIFGSNKTIGNWINEENLFGAVKYGINTGTNNFSNQTNILVGGLNRKKEFSDGAPRIEGIRDVPSTIYGLSNNLSVPLNSSLTSNLMLKGMWQDTDQKYLEYGMNSFNWDNRVIGAGLEHNSKVFDSDIKLSCSSQLEKYNPNLYFFLDTIKDNQIGTEIKRKFGSDVLAAFYVLQHTDDQREINLRSMLELAYRQGDVELRGNMLRNHTSNQVDSFGAGISYCLERLVSLDLNWSERALLNKVINDNILLGMRISLNNPPSNKEKPETDFNFKAKGMTINDVASCLNTPQKMSNYWRNNLKYNWDALKENNFYYTSPKKLFETGTGVCSDHVMSWSGILAKHGYPAYELSYYHGGDDYGHAVAIFKDEDEGRWFYSEYGDMCKLSVKDKKQLTADEAARAIVGIRKPCADIFSLFKPNGEDIFQNKDREDFIKEGRVITYNFVPLENEAKLIEDAGIKTYVGDAFWK